MIFEKEKTLDKLFKTTLCFMGVLVLTGCSIQKAVQLLPVEPTAFKEDCPDDPENKNILKVDINSRFVFKKSKYSDVQNNIKKIDLSK
jgi:hypothetical protein